MPSDAFTPRTTSRTLETPQGYRIYTTQRDVAFEYPLPVIGSLLSDSNFIAGFSGHYVMDVNDYPNNKGGKTVVVTHGPIPVGPGLGGIYTEYESVAYTFPPIYPWTPGIGEFAFFPGGSRERSRVVMGRVTYQYALDPTTGSPSFVSLPAIWDYASLTTGPFEVKSYILEAAGVNFTAGDGDTGAVGDFLNPSFIGVSTINNGLSIYAPGDLSYLVDPSVPDASTYAGWVNAKTELMTSRTLQRWYCFYLLRSVFVKAQ